MTDSKIIQAVIKKVIENGWEYDFSVTDKPNFEKAEYFSINEEGMLSVSFSGGCGRTWIHWGMMLFDHSFAEAFWGKGPAGFMIDIATIPKNFNAKEFLKVLQEAGPLYMERCEGADVQVINDQLSWQFHLRQMVLEKNHIEYLKKFGTDYLF